MHTKQYFRILFVLLGFLVAEPLSAQVTWMQPYNSHCVSAEYRNAIGLEDGDATGFALLLNGRYRFTPTIQSMFQLPVSYGKAPDYFFGNGGSSIYLGNLYYGVEFGHVDRSSGILQIGMRLPTGSIDDFDEYIAASYGTTLVYEQFEAYYPDMLSLHGAGGYRTICKKNNVVRCQWETLFGATFIKPEDVDAEVFIDGNSTLWLHTTYFRFGFGGIMRGILTEDVDDLGDRFNFQGGLSIVGVFGQIRPLIGITVPFSDPLSQQYDFTIAAGLGFDFGGNEISSSDDEL